MAIDPRKLRPTQLVQLLNSTPLGEVISERQLYRHRARAGLRIGDGRRIDLLRYVGWLVHERHSPKPEPVGPTGYEALKERARARSTMLSLIGRDIGDLPEVVNAERKAKAERDFRFFCEQYFTQTFRMAWSPDHLKVIAKIEQAVLKGGLFAMAMPRGSGKTSLCETACLWALVYGHREFVALVGADEEHAAGMLDSIKTELENNDLLLEDFPDVVYPIQCLEHIHQRAGGQLYQGKPTHIGWTAREIVLPTIPGSKVSGGIIHVAGITGRIRGMKYKRPDRESVRPSLVLIDDPQTDESARSPSQCADRKRILTGAILGLAGPGRKIAGLMTLTVVRPDDLADRIVDRDKHPQWQGERTKMVYVWPTNETLWARYAELWREGMRADRGIGEATEFYRAHRAEMDEGAVVAWPERHYPDELSAIQHAIDLKLDRGEAAFFAEYQNEPLPEEHAAEEALRPAQVADRFNGRPRGEVPLLCGKLTGFIDVHNDLLYWCVAAWQDDFTGFVISYGTFPDQRQHYFTMANAAATLKRAFPGAGEDGAIQAGLEKLVSELLRRDWPRAAGGLARIDRLLVDMGYKPGIIAAVKHKVGGSAMMLSKGVGIRAGGKPISMFQRRPGWTIGHNWYVPNVTGTREFPHVCVDVNYWKSFVHERLAVAAGDPGALTLFGKSASEHELLADHVAGSETWTLTHGHGRDVREWRQKPTHPDNHWFDCLVGCAVAASMLGVGSTNEKVEIHTRKHYTQNDLRRRWA